MGTWIEISVSTDATNSYPVVPYVGTWIEIKVAVQDGVKEAGRSLRGNVDRNISIVTELSVVSCRSLRGNVDRNLIDTNIGKESWSRSLRGNVDRNRLSVKKRM